MATVKPLTFDTTTGATRQQQDANLLNVGAGITSPAASNLLVDTPGANTVDIGTANATAVTIGRAGQAITINGNLTVTGTTLQENVTNYDVDAKTVEVNFSAAANNAAVPSGITGIVVCRGAVGGVFRDSSTLFWDEVNSTWRFSLNTANDGVTVGADQKLTVNGFTAGGAALFEGVTTASGTASFDLSGGSGIFKTSAGAITLGPGAITVSGNLVTGLTFAGGTNYTINVQASASGGVAGGDLATAGGGGAPGTTGASPVAGGFGGNGHLFGGVGGAATAAATTAQGSNAGAGGNANVAGGAGGTGAAGVGQGNAGTGGNVVVFGGVGAVAESTSTAGQSAANAGNGGNITINAGAGGAGTTAGTVANGIAGGGGNTIVNGGNAGVAGSTGAAPGGSVIVDGGVGTGGGTNGAINIGQTNAGAINIGRAGITTAMTGAFSLQAGAVLNAVGTGMINLPAQFQIAATPVSVNVSAANLGTLTAGTTSNADSLHTHNGLSGLVITGLITTGMTTGLFGYFSANSTVSKTDNAAIGTSRAAGCYTGTTGQITPGGEVTAAFTTVGGSPAAGAPVYLAAAADDTSTGAGKLTATAPAAGVVAEVGLCVDNANYATGKTVVVLIQVKSPIVL